MLDNLFLVVMAGGTGTRLWPSSRQNSPKQFINLLGTGKSLLQHTSERFDSIVKEENKVIASNIRYRDVLKTQLPKFTEHQLFLEPYKKNTAPCVAYSAYKIAKKNPEAIIIVTPSDHAIKDEETFQACVQKAVKGAEEGKLVTIGIHPSHPETGYGYIQFIQSKSGIKKVKTFTEKPELELAKKFLESGDFVWNAGIFVWKASTIIQAFETYDPEMAEIFAEGNDVYYTNQEEAFVERAYAACRNISIDYAIMEKSDNVYTVLGDFGWSDLGGWEAIYEYRQADENGNVMSGNLLEKDNKNCLFEIPKGKRAVIEGLENFLVIDNDDVLVIVPKDDSARFSRLVKEVKSKWKDDLL